jgi:hypothetical protein
MDARVSYFFLLSADFPTRRISRYAQIDLVFARSQQKMSNVRRDPTFPTLLLRKLFL